MSLYPALSIARKDLAFAFTSPLFVIFACVFVLLTGSITIYTGNFIGRQQADLQSLFQFLPWIFVFMMPALASRSWAEEFQLGTIENLFSLPISLVQLTLGKFLATWGQALIVLSSALTFWVTINYLGKPDNGVAFAGFLGAILLSGAYLSLSSLASALTSSQAVAFILSVALAFFFTALGAPIINHLFAGWLPPALFSFITSFSLLSHFANISQGILLLHDILFFLSFIATSLILTAFVLHHRRKAPLSLTPSLLPLISTFLAFLLFNFILSQSPPLRIDLTQQKLFTLSPSTSKLVKNIKKPVNVTFTYSERLNELSPAYALFASRVKGLLHELDDLGGDNLSVNFVDPLPFDTSEDNALKNGLRGLPLDDNSKVYIGISVSLADSSSSDNPSGVIPILQPDREPFIEYDIIKIIAQSQQEQQPKIGVISSLGIFGAPDFTGRTQGSPPWVAFEQANELFDLQPLFNPEDIFNQSWNLILLVHPDNSLSPRMIYALDQYILKGGSLLIFADPLSEVQPSPLRSPDNHSLKVVNTLLAPMGVSLQEDTLLADIETAVMVNTGGSANPQPLPHAAWLRLDTSYIHEDLPSLAQIQDILIPTPGVIHHPKSPSPSLTFTPLLFSSPKAIPLPTQLLKEENPNLQAFYNLATKENNNASSYPLALRITGKSTTAFPQGLPPEENPEENTEENNNDESFSYPKALASSQKPFSVTLVADVDMLRDRFWVQSQNLLGQRLIFPQNDNGAWLLNLLEVSSDNIFLLGLRGRGHTSRPFTHFEKLEQEANLLFLDKEQQLRQKLSQTEEQLTALDNNDNATSDNEREELVQQFTKTLVDTRQQLRKVQFQLRHKQEQLESFIVFFNIGFIPLLALILSGFLAWKRRPSLAS